MSNPSLSLVDAAPLGRYAAPLMAAWSYLVRVRRARRAAAELAALDDRMLRDIGLSRADLPVARSLIK